MQKTGLCSSLGHADPAALRQHGRARGTSATHPCFFNRLLNEPECHRTLPLSRKEKEEIRVELGPMKGILLPTKNDYWSYCAFSVIPRKPHYFPFS